MRTAAQMLDETYAEMRWRVLSLAADFDRVQRAVTPSGEPVSDDPRLVTLRRALARVLNPDPMRALDVQMLLSDQTPNVPG